MIQNIIKEVAKKNNVDPEELFFAYRCALNGIRTFLEMSHQPYVLLNNLGSFSIKKARIDRIIKGHIQKYKRKELSREELKEKLDYLFKVRKNVKLNPKYDRKRKK